MSDESFGQTSEESAEECAPQVAGTRNALGEPATPANGQFAIRIFGEVHGSAGLDAKCAHSIVQTESIAADPKLPSNLPGRTSARNRHDACRVFVKAEEGETISCDQASVGDIERPGPGRHQVVTVAYEESA